MLGLQALYRMFVFDMIDLLFVMLAVKRFLVWIFALASTTAPMFDKWSVYT